MPHPTIDELCTLFMAADADADGWAHLYPAEEHWESPDCDVMSARFLTFARAHGHDGHLIHATSIDEGDHWWCVLTTAGVAVDWTAKQLYNAGHPAPPTDPDLIPCPLTFLWPGTYPLDVVQFDTVTEHPACRA